MALESGLSCGGVAGLARARTSPKGPIKLRATLPMGVFMALLREPRAEAATRYPGTDLTLARSVKGPLGLA